MRLIKMDIDQLLEETSNMDNGDFPNLKLIEIDTLLDKTQDW